MKITLFTRATAHHTACGMEASKKLFDGIVKNIETYLEEL